MRVRSFALLVMVGVVVAAVWVAASPVPRGFALLMAHLAASAWLTEIPEGARVDRDLVYATRGERPLHLDLIRPARGEGPFPTILWFHGGGFRAGDQRSLRPGVLAQVERGWAVASIEYSLVHEGRWPMAGEDAKAAVRWLRHEAERLGIDPGRFVAWGESAGGLLAGLLGTTGDAALANAALGPQGVTSAVQGVVLWYAPTDLVARADAGESQASSIALLGCDPRECPERARSASPAAGVAYGAPPFIVLHGTGDTLVGIEQSERLVAQLREAGVEAEFDRVEGYVHGDLRFSRAPAITPVERFLDRRRAR